MDKNLKESFVDKKDKLILKTLFEDGRLSIANIAKRTGLRRDSIARRLKKLQNSKVIEGFIPLINPSVLGLPNYSILLIKTKTSGNKDDFIKKVTNNKYVFHFSKIIGKFDFYCVIAFKDISHLNNIIENIKSYVSDFVTDLDVYQTAEEYKVEDMSNLL